MLSESGVSFSLCEDGEALATLKLGANDVEGLIALLVAYRGKMRPEVPHTLPEPRPYAVLVDPRYQVQRARDGTVVLALRHPGIEWLLMQFPEAGAAKLGAFLVGPSPQAEQHPPRDRLH